MESTHIRYRNSGPAKSAKKRCAARPFPARATPEPELTPLLRRARRLHREMQTQMRLAMEAS